MSISAPSFERFICSPNTQLSQLDVIAIHITALQLLLVIFISTLFTFESSISSIKELLVKEHERNNATHIANSCSKLLKMREAETWHKCKYYIIFKFRPNSKLAEKFIGERHVYCWPIYVT